MGFLSPWVLAAAAAVVVPVWLHLVQRRKGQRISFPALRYLKRAEREHAQRIRLRQILLLVLRTSAILLIALAGARLFLPGPGGSHRPTALAIVLDNSMSTGLVTGDRRVFDDLRDLALAVVERAGADDEIWVIRAGEPWDVAPPGGPLVAAERVRASGVSAASGDLAGAVARAAELLRGSDREARELVLLSDLQETGFRDLETEVGVRALVWAPDHERPVNRYLHRVRVGGGLAPLAGQRTDVTVSVGSTDPGDTAEAAIRLLMDGRVRGASQTAPGRSAVLAFGPLASGGGRGIVETDPDALRVDDRRYFTVAVRPPSRVGLVGEAPLFLEEALNVLAESDRIVRSDAEASDVVVSVGGAGSAAGRPIVLVPAADVTLLPALNRALAGMGIPWRVEPAEVRGESPLVSDDLPLPLEDVVAIDPLRLVPASPDVDADVVIRLATGEPWLVRGREAPYALLASPLDEVSTTLIRSAAMVPLVEWLLTRWAEDTAGRTLEAGETLPLPSNAAALRLPDGSLRETEGSVYRATGQTGFYEALAGDTVLRVYAVNPPLRESLLRPIRAEELEPLFPAGFRAEGESEAFEHAAFGSGQGSEPWRALLAVALLVLVAESWLAAPGGAATGRAEGTRVAD